MRGLRGGAAELTPSADGSASLPLPLQRGPVTLAIYVMAATWGWWLYSFGPAMVLLRDEQGTSRAVASLHGTLLAVGALLAGVLAAPMVQWFGRRRLLAMGCAGIAGGVVLLVTGPGLAFTLLAALVIGTFGSMAFNMTTPVLTAAHRETAPAAISEANAVAATVGLLAPLGLGAAVVVGWGWRAAAAVSAATALLTVAAVVRAGSSPAWSTRPVTRAAGRTPFTLPFWAIWVALVACIGVEFASTFWAADLLMTEHGMPPGRAAAAVAALVGGMAAGRWVAAWAARRWAAAPMLTVALIVAGVGWLVMWVAPGPVTAVCGLALLGLGMSWHFPMTITLLIKAAGPGRTDSAAGLASVGAGIASGGAPFLLGALADRVGPHSAFGVVPVLLLAALVGLRVATRAD